MILNKTNSNKNATCRDDTEAFDLQIYKLEI